MTCDARYFLVRYVLSIPGRDFLRLHDLIAYRKDRVALAQGVVIVLWKDVNMHEQSNAYIAFLRRRVGDTLVNVRGYAKQQYREVEMHVVSEKRVYRKSFLVT